MASSFPQPFEEIRERRRRTEPPPSYVFAKEAARVARNLDCPAEQRGRERKWLLPVLRSGFVRVRGEEPDQLCVHDLGVAEHEDGISALHVRLGPLK